MIFLLANNIGPEGAMTISSALHGAKHLRVLNIGGWPFAISLQDKSFDIANKIGADGLAAVANLLPQLTELRLLSVSGSIEDLFQCLLEAFRLRSR